MLRLSVRVEDNIIAVELRGNQLADSPAQREGAIRSETVLVDIRQRGVRSDGSEWQGTPLADASGEISNIERTVGERSLDGGTIELGSEGAVIVADGAVLDVSGGVTTYSGGDVTTSRLLGEDGRIYDIAEADRDRNYVRVIDSFTVEHPRWGVTEVFEGFQAQASGTFEAGYVEGYDAGSVSIISPRFILDGSIAADRVTGRYQRNAPTAVAEGTLYRPFDQLPLGGQLSLGGNARNEGEPNAVLSDLTLVSGDVLPTLTNVAGDPFDPLVDRLPDDFASTLDPALIGADGIANLTVFANGRVTFVDDASLSVPAGSRLSLTAAEILFGADYESPGGTVELTARVSQTNALNTALTVGATSDISVAGVWANDNPLTNPSFEPTVIDGGTVSITNEAGDLTLADGSRIDVSGGAYRTDEGAIIAGTAGSIAIEAGPTVILEPTTLTIGAELLAFALSDGGALSVTANLVCIATSDCADDAGELWLTPDLYFDAGFADVAVNSNVLGVELVEGTQIVGRQVNRQFDDNTALVVTGTPLETFTSVATLPDIDRNPVALSFNADTSGSQLLVLDDYVSARGLILGSNSRIDTDPRSRVRLDSNTVISMQGTISAPAGSIAVELDNELLAAFARPVGAIGGIWLGESARLDVSGTSLSQVDSLGRRIGDVFDGGVVAITANRDGISLAPGSIIDVSGTSASLTVQSGTANNPGFSDQLVGSNGGSLSLIASEYLLVSGNIDAAGGDVDGTRGGEFFAALNGNLRGSDPTGGNEPSLSLDSRRIVVTPFAELTTLPVGAAIPDNRVGEGRIGVDTLTESGFFDVTLQAETLASRRNGSGFLASLGEIVFEGGVDLSVPGRLVIDASRILGGTGDVSLSANYIRLEHSLNALQGQGQSIGDAIAIGSGAFNVDAALVDVLGAVRIGGFESSSIASAGDLRVTGFRGTGDRTIPGQLVTDTDLTLQAQQIYPTTLSDFDIVVEGDTGTLQTLAVPGGAAVPLSAAGALSLSAATIVHNGVLRAPSGTISFNAADVTLADGSLTSTSLSDTLVPFGTLQGGLDWAYELDTTETLVFDGVLETPPEQRIDVNAENFDFRDGATIDVSAGGDLLGYEFVPGIGGSDDYLSPEVSPNLFAIIPGSDFAAAPIDLAESNGVNLQPGDAVFLEGIGDLPAGTYTLLPARYAILPDAVLISPVEGYTDIRPGEAFTGLDGSVIIAGRATVAGTDVLATRSQGFALLPRSRAFDEAQYDLALASDFFADSGFRTPLDAGTIGIDASASLALSGQLTAATSRLGSAVDISTAQLRVVDTLGSADDGFVELRAAELSDLGADSILLGGRRSSEAEGTRIDVTASVVEVAAGAELTAPEAILVARDGVTLAEGSSFSANGTASATSALLIDGDAAIVRASSGSQRDIVRSDVQGLTGDIDIQTGATLSAGGSIAIDGSGDVASAGNIGILDGSLRLGAASIILGDAPPDSSGLVLDNAALAAIDASELVLASGSDIAAFGTVDLSVSERLVINATGLSAAPDAALGLFAPEVVIAGNGIAAPAPAAGDGTATISGDTLEFDDGNFVFDGFDTLNLTATNTATFAGSGELLAPGALNLSAGLFAVAVGADYAVRADGNLTLQGTATAAAPLTSSGPGGRLVLASTQGVQLDAPVVAEAGIVRLDAGTGVDVGANASIDVAGRAYDFDGLAASSPGGTIALDAGSGNLALAAGASLDVSSPGAGRAGTLELVAPTGTITNAATLAGAGGDAGGRFRVDGNSIANSGSLIDAAIAGGFTSEVSLRQRGVGDLAVSAGQTVVASEFRLQADQGSVRVDGDIRLSGSTGRRLDLAARDDVVLNGDVRVDSIGADDFGTVIALTSTSSGLLTGANSVIEAVGDTEIWVSVTRDALDTLLDADPTNNLIDLAGAIVGDAAIVVEGRQHYDVADGSIDAADTAADPANPWFADATAFMSNADALTAALGFAGDDRFDVLPGLVLETPGDLTVASAFNLFDWRFNDLVADVNDERPGVLTLRAGGNLAINAAINDAFTTATATALTYTGDSWSYRLIGGADFGGADMLSVDASSGADLTVARNVAVRTGNGRVDVAVARDFVLAEQSSVLYTSGLGIDGSNVFNIRPIRTFPDQGGDIRLFAGRDVVGAPSDQLFTAWLWRSGQSFNGELTQIVAWSVNFGAFEQGIGALGGGNVSVVAGNDIVELSASVPSIGRQFGEVPPGPFQDLFEPAPEDNAVEILAGGNLAVEAGNDILGGSYLVGLGDGRLDAGGQFSVGADFAPILALGDAQIAVTARADLQLELGVGQTLIPQAAAQIGADAARRSFFSTYGEDSGIWLTSVGGAASTGNAILTDSGSDFVSRYGSGRFSTLGNFASEQFALILMPPTLDLRSFGSDVRLPANFSLFPSPSGDLNLLAAENVILGQAGLTPIDIILSDAQTNDAFTVELPARTLSQAQDSIGTRFFELTRRSIEFNSPIPVHIDNSEPVRLVALNGDVGFAPSTGRSTFYSAKPVRVSAGRDIIDFSIEVQNTSSESATVLAAGRDIIFQSRRDDQGRLLRNDSEITVNGPGLVQLRAGRDIDLQTSAGVTSNGDITNSFLPDGGATISLIAGLGDTEPQFDAFIDRYLVMSDDYDGELIDYVNGFVDQAVATKAAALDAFEQLDEPLQEAFAEQVFFAELRTSGREAAQPGELNNDFTRGFDALTTLFPGSNPAIEDGEVNAYSGDVRLFFSRVYTLDGGNIRILVPGGEINAGLATPPTSFGVDKSASQLGIVAQRFGDIQGFSFGDFAVNESRVFAADGGDILIWSTRGDIDAGRGAKTAISAPPPVITIDPVTGATTTEFPAALTGSGIQTLATTPGVEPGNVDLFAPRGVVNAGDAGIVAGNLTIAAVAVLGADNIQVSGISVGVPTQSVPTAGLGNASAVASSAQNTAQAAAVPQASDEESSTPLADQALGFLDVFILGFGDCNPETGEGCDDAT